MAKQLRVHQLAKELGVASKAIVDKCQAEDIDGIVNHMSLVSAGLAASIREWFSEGEDRTTIETADRVDLKKVRRKRRKAEEPASVAVAEGEEEAEDVEEQEEAGVAVAEPEPAAVPEVEPAVEAVPAEAAEAVAATESAEAAPRRRQRWWRGLRRSPSRRLGQKSWKRLRRPVPWRRRLRRRRQERFRRSQLRPRSLRRGEAGVSRSCRPARR